jgi:hypothetical protein
VLPPKLASPEVLAAPSEDSEKTMLCPLRRGGSEMRQISVAARHAKAAADEIAGRTPGIGGAETAARQHLEAGAVKLADGEVVLAWNAAAGDAARPAARSRGMKRLRRVMGENPD